MEDQETKPALASVTIWSDIGTAIAGIFSVVQAVQLGLPVEAGLAAVIGSLLGIFGRKRARKQIKGVL